MIAFELEQLQQNEDWQRVLSAYQSVELALKVSSEEHDGWLERLETVEGIKPEHLSRIHGKLIALGMLTFQLSGRSTGVQYRLTPSANKALAQLTNAPTEAADSTTDRDEEDNDFSQAEESVETAPWARSA